MTDHKDIRFPDKKVDESWKEHITKDLKPSNPASDPPKERKDTKSKQMEQETSKPFVNLISSLGYQAMLYLGDIPNPASGQSEFNSDAAREIIDLLIAIQNKTSGNRSAEEETMLASLVSELQLKFSQKI